jgi:hypothetical protein
MRTASAKGVEEKGNNERQKKDGISYEGFEYKVFRQVGTYASVPLASVEMIVVQNRAAPS